MKLTYCKNWSSLLPGPNRPMTEARARHLHERRGRFEVIIEDDAGIPRYVVIASLETNGYLIYFLDDQFREALTHGWDDSGDGRLFLGSISKRDYLSDGVNAKFKVVGMHFDKDGTVWDAYSDAFGWQRRDLYRGLDVSDHYEPWPEFGHYERLLRRERSVPPGFGL